MYLSEPVPRELHLQLLHTQNPLGPALLSTRPGGPRKRNQSMGTQLPAPQSFIELQEQFRTESDCEANLIALLWPGGFECLECGFLRAACNEKRRMHQCPNCRSQTCVTAGSIMKRRTRR